MSVVRHNHGDGILTDMSGYVDPTAVPQVPDISEKEDIAQCLGITVDEVTSAGRLLFIFGHRLVRREPITSSQMSKIYVESKFNRREFGKNRSNDSNATIRRLLSTWSKSTRSIESLARSKECCASGCTIYEPHRLCARRDNTWIVYFMRPSVWESLYSNMDTWSDRVKEIFNKVTITDPNLTFFDAENEMVYNVDAEDLPTSTHQETHGPITQVREEFTEFGADTYQPEFIPQAPVKKAQSVFTLLDEQDKLWEQFFPFHAPQ